MEELRNIKNKHKDLKEEEATLKNFMKVNL